MHQNPDSPITRNFRIKERHVIEALLRADLGVPEGVTHVWDRAINGPCSSHKRPDIRWDFGTFVLILEIDEYGHPEFRYPKICENRRTMHIFEDVGGRPLVVLRFNPDAYTAANGEKIPSCFNYHKKLGIPNAPNSKDWKMRIAKVIERLQNWVEYAKTDGAPEKEITMEYLYFDEE
jgi:hypothetical protein